MNRAVVPRGLYAVTDESRSGSDLVRQVAQAIHGGAVMVQYRDKHSDAGQRLWQANDLQMLCHSLQVPLIINDDIELARDCRAAGVHLGKDDASIATARTVLGTQAIIGVSCYNSLALAQAAQAAGADYVAFGSFFVSSTKPDAVRADLALLGEAQAALTIPIVAIGGISVENGGALVAAGASLLAVVSDLFGATDITASARDYTQLFS
ncbi:MAG: thiamine phosphate synthase [Gammaproteobacteria bacterium]